MKSDIWQHRKCAKPQSNRARNNKPQQNKTQNTNRKAIIKHKKIFSQPILYYYFPILAYSTLRSSRLGVNLTPIIIKKVLSLHDLRGKSFAVDANNYLYQFLSLIRMPDGTPLKDSQGNITSHLAGLISRSTRLMHDYNMDLIFIFDGEPPHLKKKEITKRREQRNKATIEWQTALKKGDYSKAFSKAVMTSRLTQPMIKDAKHVLSLLGIPLVQAPSEAEAQGAYMAMKGDVWAASSKDYDSLLFGAPRLLRYLTISGQEFLPSKGISRPLKPELIELDKFLSRYKITREQLIDIAILIGTDFNEGIKGIGPKTALKTIQKHGQIENTPADIKSKIQTQDYNTVRKFFLQPKVTSEYSLKYTELNEDELYHFLCEQRDFSTDRVETATRRMKEFYGTKRQTELKKWFSANQI
jgi:flap endonuclease-1